MVACQKGKLKQVKPLLQETNVLFLANLAFREAVKYNHTDVALFLLVYCDPQISLNHCLSMAIRNHNIVLENELMSRCDVFAEDLDYNSFNYMSIIWQEDRFNQFLDSQNVPSSQWDSSIILAAHLPYVHTYETSIRKIVNHATTKGVNEAIQVCYETRNDHVLDILCEHKHADVLKVCIHYLDRGFFGSEKSKNLFKKIPKLSYNKSDLRTLFYRALDRLDWEYIFMLMPHCKSFVSPYIINMSFQIKKQRGFLK